MSTNSEHDDVAEALRAHLDANMLTAREFDQDMGLVLARRRRRLFAGVALPSAFAVGALALFVVMARDVGHESTGTQSDDVVHIYIADANDPASAIVIDFDLSVSPPGKQP